MILRECHLKPKANIGGNNGLFDMTEFCLGRCWDDNTLSVPFIVKGDGIVHGADSRVHSG